MTLAVSNIAWSYSERLDAYKLLKASGANGLEIAPGLLFANAPDPFNPSPNEIERALSEIDDAGLTLVSMQSLLYGVKGAALFGTPAARQRIFDALKCAIALAARLSIPNLVFGSPTQRNIPDHLSEVEARTHAGSFFRDLGDNAAKAQTVIAVEPNPMVYGTNFINTLREAGEFVREVSHPNIGLNLDLGAMHVNGEFEDTVQQIEEFASIISHVHISEPDLAPAPAEPARLNPVIRALRSVGYSKAISIEMRRGDRGLLDVRDGLRRLQTATESPQS